MKEIHWLTASLLGLRLSALGTATALFSEAVYEKLLPHNCLTIWDSAALPENSKQPPNFKGRRVSCQLFHGGRRGASKLEGGRELRRQKVKTGGRWVSRGLRRGFAEKRAANSSSETRQASHRSLPSKRASFKALRKSADELRT